MSKNVTKITIYSSAITFNSMFVRIYRLGDWLWNINKL
jgi:hypothetical protein